MQQKERNDNAPAYNIRRMCLMVSHDTCAGVIHHYTILKCITTFINRQLSNKKILCSLLCIWNAVVITLIVFMTKLTNILSLMPISMLMQHI